MRDREVGVPTLGTISGHKMSDYSEALQIWREKLNHLLKEQACNADASRDFQLQKEIDAAIGKMEEVRAHLGENNGSRVAIAESTSGNLCTEPEGSIRSRGVQFVASIEVHLDQPIESFDPRDFEKALEKLVGSKVNRVRIASIRRGSVIIKLEGNLSAILELSRVLRSEERGGRFAEVTHLVSFSHPVMKEIAQQPVEAIEEQVPRNSGGPGTTGRPVSRRRKRRDEYPTIKDAAAEFGVTTKTVQDWIANGIIPPPPKKSQGLRDVQIFPREYMSAALRDLERQRRSRSKG